MAAQQDREAMRGLDHIKYWLKLGPEPEHRGKPAGLDVHLEQLEASQETLKKAIVDSGFFLGDSLVRQKDARSRARARYYNRQSD
jgi:hypothetical protein